MKSLTLAFEGDNFCTESEITGHSLLSQGNKWTTVNVL